MNFQHPARTRAPAIAIGVKTLLDQLRALAADDPDFLSDIIEGETDLLWARVPADAFGVKQELEKAQDGKLAT